MSNIGASEKLLQEINRVRKIYFESNQEDRKAIGAILAGDIDIRKICLSENRTSHNVVTGKNN